ncbi:MAG: SGNH/GDSL hydrolase family protein [Chloroflexota bacterium]
MPAPQPRVLFLRATLIVVAIILPLVVLELAMRAFGPFLPGSAAANLYSAAHPLYGFARVPGMVGWVRSDEFLSRVAINSLGLREREIPYAKPAGHRRVLMLGDSFVEGVQVRPEETAARVLESVLQPRVPGVTQVINAGSGGWSTAQEYEFLRHEGVQYAPDLVVLVFYTGNDVTDNSFKIKGNVRNLRKPYYALRNGRLELQPWTPRRSAAGSAETGRELYLWNVFQNGVLARVPGRNATNLDDDDERLLDQLVETEIRVFSTSQKAEWAEAWDVTEGLIVAARELSEATQAQFLLVNAPTVWEIYPAQWESFRAANKLRADGWDLDAPRRRLADLAGRHGIEYLDLGPPLVEAARSQPPLYYSKDLHWSAAGQRVVGQTLAEHIQTRFAATALGQ